MRLSLLPGRQQRRIPAASHPASISHLVSGERVTYQQDQCQGMLELFGDLTALNTTELRFRKGVLRYFAATPASLRTLP
jgi:hypothetical protein